MVLPVIICLLKPSSPICQDKPQMEATIDPDLADDFTQQELLQFGGTGLVVALLLALLIWALSKASALRRRIQAAASEETAQELREIRRSIREDGARKLI